MLTSSSDYAKGYLPEGYTRSINLKQLIDMHGATGYRLLRGTISGWIILTGCNYDHKKTIDIPVPNDVFIDKTEVIAELLEQS